MARRSLRDIFNGRSLRRALAVTVGTTALFASPFLAGPSARHDTVAATVAVTAPADPCPPEKPVPDVPYEDQLFSLNDPAQTQSLRALPAEGRIQYYLDQSCFTADKIDSNSNPRDNWLVTALKDLRQAGNMGGPLLAMAANDKIHICSMPHLPAGTGAQYLPAHQLVVARPNASILGETLDLAHEFTHRAQDAQGVMTYYYRWDIQSRVTRNLVDEAAPIALEFAVAYERKYAGDERYVAYLKQHDAVTAYTDPANHKAFEDAYIASTDAGAAPADALRAGAHAVFERVFNSLNWRNFYLNSELNSYIDDIASGKFAPGDTIQHNAFAPADIAKAGKIGALPSWTEGATVPSYETLLSHDRKMAWAYEAADLARTRIVLGENDPAVSAMRAQAILGGNPYLGLDMAAVSKRAAQVRFAGALIMTYSVMDQMLTEPTQAPKNSCPVTPPAAPKIAGSLRRAG